MKHTPGPWKVKPLGKQLYVESESGAFVCDMQVSDNLGEMISPQIQADAALIAAAPEMLKVLKDLLTWDDGNLPGDLMDAAQRITTLAEGKDLGL
jgi:hypothetical protein